MQIHKYLCAGQMKTQFTHSFVVGVKVLKAKSHRAKVLDLSIGQFCMNFNPFCPLKQKLKLYIFQENDTFRV